MPIGLVDNTSNAGTANSCTTSAINTIGSNLLIAIVSYYGGAIVTTSHISDSASNTWTQLTDISVISYHTRTFYCLNPTTNASHTFTLSGAGTYSSINFSAWSGIDSYYTENGSANVSVTNITPGTTVPSTNGSLLITGFTNVTDRAYSIDSGFTELTRVAFSSGVNMGGEYAYLIQSVASSITPYWSWTGSDNVSTAIAVFNPNITTSNSYINNIFNNRMRR